MAITPEEFIKGAEDKAPEQQWRHRWFTTIIPCGSLNEPVIVNYCPNCRVTYTQVLGVAFQTDYSSHGLIQGARCEDKLDLPKYGCDAPEGI